MAKLEYTTSNGQTIELYGAPFHLYFFEGDVEANIQMQKSPYQDGSTYIDTVLSERYIPIELKIRAKDEKDLADKKRQLSSAFNPKLGLGLLRYQNTTDDVKEIYAVSENVPFYPDGPTNRGKTFQKALISLIAPNPYWQDIYPTNIKLEDFVANFSFPFSFPVSFSIRGDSKVLINNGHVPTPVEITFRGEAINPKVTKNSTGEFIRINRPIPAEHSLVITTGFNEKTVKIIDPYGNELNAMGYIDLNSTFFSLDVGDNQLSFITDGGNPDVFIEYKNLYLSV
ncbi:MAG: phage tail family protein [Psychrobacillus psychrodurans]